jgi:hypothetical protein
MASQAPSGAKTRQTGRVKSDGIHEGFLRHRNFRWFKLAGGLSLISIIAYILIDVEPRHNGGSWYGYLLGTIGAGLIIWLTTLGIRKRNMTPKAWSLKAWTSAHVYLGLSLIVIGTLHTGFQFGCIDDDRHPVWHLGHLCLFFAAPANEFQPRRSDRKPNAGELAFN